MARSFNKVFLIGYTADEPVVRTFDNGKVANLTVVTNESIRRADTGEYEEHPEWNRIVFWNHQANIVESYVHKGMRLFIEGKLRTRSYTDKQGIKRFTTEIISENMIMLDNRGNNIDVPPASARPPFNDSNGFGSRPNNNYRSYNSRPNGGYQQNQGAYPQGQGGYQQGGYQGAYQQSQGGYGNNWNQQQPQPAGNFPPYEQPQSAPAYPNYENPYSSMSAAPAGMGAAAMAAAMSNAFNNAAAAAPFDDGGFGGEMPEQSAAPAQKAAPAAPAANPQAAAPAQAPAPVTDNSNDDDIPF